MVTLVTAAVWLPLTVQLMVNQVPVTVTGSEKVTVMSVAGDTLAPLVGVARSRRGEVGGEVEGEIGRHGVGRVVGVLVGTCAATTVTVQTSPPTKSVLGFRVKVVGPPVTVAACAPLVRTRWCTRYPSRSPAC